MSSMNGMQEELRRSLLEINNQCQDLRKDIAVFVNNVSTLPAAKIKIRLSVMRLQITEQTSKLHITHDWKGVVYAMMTDTLLNFYWAEKEFPIEVKEDLKRKGYLVLSTEEIVKMIDHLSDGIDSGQSAEAVEWINRYETSLALKTKKLL